MIGTFYGIGVGPGDPELITYKAVNTINKCQIIAVPKSGSSENMALSIAKQHITSQQIIEIDMPMTRDENLLNQSHDTAATKLGTLLEQGNNIGFLTIGDPSVYASVMYIHKRLKDKGYNTAIIPGITSFCAAAASLNTSLCEREQLLHIIPASYEDLDYALNLKGNKVLMKSGKSLATVKEKLSKHKGSVSMVTCASGENERIFNTLEEIDENAGYFSLIVVK